MVLLFTFFNAELRSLLGIKVCREQGAASRFLPPALQQTQLERSWEAPPRLKGCWGPNLKTRAASVKLLG